MANRGAGTKAAAGVIVDTVAGVIVDAKGVVTPVPGRLARQIRKLEKKLVAARKTESKRLRQLAAAEASKSRSQVGEAHPPGGRGRDRGGGPRSASDRARDRGGRIGSSCRRWSGQRRRRHGRQRGQVRRIGRPQGGNRLTPGQARPAEPGRGRVDGGDDGDRRRLRNPRRPGSPLSGGRPGRSRPRPSRPRPNRRRRRRPRRTPAAASRGEGCAGHDRRRPRRRLAQTTTKPATPATSAAASPAAKAPTSSATKPAATKPAATDNGQGDREAQDDGEAPDHREAPNDHPATAGRIVRSTGLTDSRTRHRPACRRSRSRTSGRRRISAPIRSTCSSRESSVISWSRWPTNRPSSALDRPSPNAAISVGSPARISQRPWPGSRPPRARPARPGSPCSGRSRSGARPTAPASSRTRARSTAPGSTSCHTRKRPTSRSSA